MLAPHGVLDPITTHCAPAWPDCESEQQMNNRKSFPKRSLGSSGIEVSAIGLGCMSLSGVYGKSSDDDGISLIHEALDQGITLLDTSDMYGFGHNEELVGKAIKGRRDEVVLATKFGNLGGGGSQDRRRPAGIRRQLVRGEPQAARRRGDRSLLSAPGRSDRAGRRHLRRHGAAGRARQSPHPWHQRGASGDHPPGARGSPARRRAERIFAALPHGSRGDAEHDARA